MIGLGVVAVLFSGVVNANADFYSVDSGVALYDTVGDKYWRQNLHEFTSQTYQEQIESIDTLTFGESIGKWRMADISDIEALVENYNFSVISTTFMISTEGYWDGRINYSPESGSHVLLSLQDTDGDGTADLANGKTKVLIDQSGFNWGWTHLDSSEFGGLGAWVVADRFDSNSGSDPVPEPATMILFVTGIAGLAAASRRKKA